MSVRKGERNWVMGQVGKNECTLEEKEEPWEVVLESGEFNIHTVGL